MDTSKAPHEAYARNLMEAAAWLTHFAENDTDTSAEFEEWLGAEPKNQAAWRQVQRPWKEFTEQANAPEVIQLRRAALGRAGASGKRRWRTYTTQSWMRYAQAAGVGVFLVGGAAAWMLTRPDVYRTRIGEQRQVTLSDGSQLALDAHSEVRVSYSRGQRELRMTRGQARFNVAPDVGRPFSVEVNGRKVLALGTAFNVDLLGLRTQVTLIDGRVVVFEEADREGIELRPGERLSLAPGVAPQRQAVSLDVALAWQEGQLFFDDEPLSAVVERVNRYSSRAIEVADAATGALRVSGAFNTGDPERFVATIESHLPVKAEGARSGGIRLIRR